MLNASTTKTRFLLTFGSGVLVFLSCAKTTPSQDITASVPIETRTAAAFCLNLREAVRARDRTKISSWVLNFPIEIHRDTTNVLVVDSADFVRKFDLIFDKTLKFALDAPTGCEAKLRSDGDMGLAGDQIILSLSEGETHPHISEISPPADTGDIGSDQYEKGAQEFFTSLQKAISADNKAEVASMSRYPFLVNRDGKHVTIKTRAELIDNYPQIFTPAVKKAILKLTSPIHMGWRGFMTDTGELWFDWVVWTHVYRVSSINVGQ